MPTFNNGNYISVSIKSVLSQTFTDLELIIIDDGSTDETQNVVAQFKADNRVVYIKNSENKGLIYSLNLGLESSKGELIARIDSDDLWVDDRKLEKQIDFMENEGVGLLGTGAKAIDENGNTLFFINLPTEDAKIRKSILVKNCFVHSSVLFNKELAMKCGGYKPEQKFVEDYGLWMRMGQIAKLANLPELMVGYRVNQKGETQKNNKVQILNNLSIIREFRDIYPNYSLGWFKWNLRLVLTNLFGSFGYWRIKKALSQKV